MIVAIADSHTAIWYLFGDSRLSPAAKSTIDDASAQGFKVGISPITLAEIIYLEEKGRVPATTFDRVLKLLASPGVVFQEVPFDSRIADKMRAVPRGHVPDLPDRIIAATALFLQVPVISRDSRIQASDLTTIW